MSAMDLHVDVRLPDRGVDIRLDVPAGTTLALLGANGAGKSTVLETIAGLLTPYDGQVGVGDRVLTRVEAGRRRTWVAPHARSIGLLAQEARLFPHMDARTNVAFGPRSAGVPRGVAGARADEWLARVGLADLGRRRTSQLSGGQAQRVALARALAADPAVVLLDEPLAALDVDVTPALRHLLREVLADRTAVVVTHDVLDALLLADTVAVLDAGTVVEHGPTARVLGRPRSAFGARIAGLNLVRGVWADGVLRTPTATIVQGGFEGEPRDGGEVVAVFRPAAVAVHPEVATVPGSPRNSFTVRVETLEPYGDLVRVRGGHVAGALHADVTPAAVAELGLVPGQTVRFVVKAAEVQVHPAS